MEVFCRNLPDHVTDHQLQKAFAPIFKEFSIYTYVCRKLSRGFATVTILDAKKAQCLLDRYVQNRNGKRRPQLKLFDKTVLVSKSRETADEHLLRSLEEEETRRKQKVPRSSAPAVDRLTKSFAITSLSCGLWDYNSDGAVFVRYFRYAQRGRLSFGRSALNVRLELPEKPLAGLEVEYDYDSISGSIYLGRLSNPTVTLSLTRAPRLYERGPQDVLQEGSVPDEAFLAMVLEKVVLKNKEIQRRRLDSLGKQSDAVASTCFAYQFTLTDVSDIRLILELQREKQIPRLVSWQTSSIEPRTSYIEQLARFLASLAHHAMSYPLKFQLQRLVWNGILSPDKVRRLIPVAYTLQLRVGPDCAAHCIRKLERQIQFAGPEADRSEFDIETLGQFVLHYEESAAQYDAYIPRTNRSPNGTWIHKAMVTPLGIYLYGPYWESKNRVLRSYATHTDFFMRVEFMEETGDPIRFEQNASLDQIFGQRFKTVLQNGFIIGGRHFEFLGFSHSSLRSQSCWFMAAFTTATGEALDARTIIRKLGDFSHIMSPAKCAARIGQALSETVPSVEIALEAVEIAEDIERGDRVFSDGVGTVSRSIMDRIWDKYALHAKVKPTVIQIRFAGAKGMISLDTRRSGDMLMLRKSMVKFYGSDARNIEICGSGIRPLPLRLNRQLIKILEDLGVPAKPLISMQQEEVDGLRKTAQNPILAAHFLEKSNLPNSAMIPFLIRTLVRLRLNFLQDDFLQKMIELAVLVKLRELKYRARILVKHGVNLHGIMDETGFLQDGEVYCPTIDDNTGIRSILIGNVVITRAPALHPGDIQLADAVGVPEDSPLNDLHNCIVFSQHGSRDLPSMLSGGDLDGDLYSIIYDHRLRPKRVAQAADYPRVEALALNRPVEPNDIIDHFLTFMQQDQLGRIATLHQAIADQKHEGIFDNDCLVLAELHSTAVDYSKTGIPANIKRLPKNKRIRPDFMAPGPRVVIEESIELAEAKVQDDEGEEQDSFYRYYESSKTLGLLYRAIDEQAILKDLKQTTAQLKSGTPKVFSSLWSYVMRETAGFIWEHCIDTATEIKEMYEDYLVDLMYQYSATPWATTIDELEVFIGNVVGKTHGQTKRQRETSMHMRDDYEGVVEFTVSRIRNKEGGRAESLERSIACMSLGLEQDGRNRQVQLGRMNLLSFRWIAASVCLQEMERMHKYRVL